MTRKYVEDVLETLPEISRQRILKTMEKYGDNRWWRSDDLVEVGYHQLLEDVLMVPVDVFTKAVEKLLGRPVYTHEFSSMYREELLKEAEEAYELHKKGLMESLTKSKVFKELAAKKVRNNMLKFEDHMRKRGKKVIYFNPDTDEDSSSDSSEL